MLHEASVAEDALPTLAIRPYPVQYVGAWTLKNGTEVTIRPIRPEDEPLMVRFHETVSERSVYFRYLHMMGLRIDQAPRASRPRARRALRHGR